MNKRDVWGKIMHHLEELMVEVEDNGCLDLDSLAVINLHDRLEQTFDVRIRAVEVTRERFGSLQALVDLVCHLVAANDKEGDR